MQAKIPAKCQKNKKNQSILVNHQKWCQFFSLYYEDFEQQKLQNIYVIEVHMKYLGSKLKFPGFTASELSKGNNWHKNTTNSQQFSVLAQTL